ncbi:MAG: DUF1559 family PulG-like putative transporter, partial [Thermoguttaceae bacterium]
KQNPWIDIFWNDSVVRGVFGARSRYVTMAEIKDGTSNTAAMSETSFTGTQSWDTIHGDYVEGMGNLDVRPADCLARKGPAGTILSGAVHERSRRGAWWSGGGPVSTGFHTILGPNSIACNSGDGEWGPRMIMPPDSFHPGGVNVAMADGSIHFISDTINTGNTAAPTPSTSTGVSPYGVWGALGTMRGGEAVTMP